MQLKQALWGNLIYTIIQFSLPMITMVWFAHALGAAAFGELSWVESVCRLLGLLFSMGIPIFGPKALMQCDNDGERKTVLNLFLRIHLGIVLFMVTVLISCSQGLRWTGFLPWPWIFLVSQVFQLEWYFQGTQQFNFVIKRSLWIRLLALVFVCIFINKPQDVYIGFLILTATQIVLGLFNVLHLRKKLIFSFRLGIDKQLAWLRPLFWVSISSLMITGYTLLDTVILGWYSDSMDVGNYSVAVRIAKLPMVLMGAFVSMIVLKLTSINKTGTFVEFEALIEKSFKTLMLAILPITVLFISLPEVWIDLVGGSTFNEAPEVLKIVAWILPLMVISNVFGFQVLISMNKEQRYIFVALGGLVTALVSFFVLIPRWGITGAAYGTLLTEFIVASLAIIFSQWWKKALYLLKFVVQYSLLLIPTYLLLIYMGSVTESKVALCILGPGTMLIYCAFVIYFVLNEQWCFQGVFSKWLG
jgi:O-antigen/teichoic acid export membrane protein